MSRLLFLLPSVPDPPDSGAKLRNLMLLRLLREEHAVDAIAFGQPRESERLSAVAQRVRVVPPPHERNAWRRALGAARSRLPDMAMRLWSPELADAVRCLAEDAEVVQAEGIEMARYLSLAAAHKRVYDAHNPEFLLQRRFSEMAQSPLGKMYSRVQWRRLERFEQGVVRSSRLTLAVSEHDANQLRALADGACVAVVPNGIDTRAYDERPEPPGKNLLFLGKLDYRPNAEAVRWLLTEVLPKVFSRAPDERLFVVGANPPRWLVEACQHDARIAVTGHVVDERTYLNRCSALLLPIRVAAGTRLKALVAMASGVPIVSTGLGMEGLSVEPGVDYVRAESADEWVHAIREVLGDATVRTVTARRARRLVEERYSWDALRTAVHVVYASVPR